MEVPPLTNGPDGRDRRGRFSRGNKAGRGNHLSGRAAAIRAVLLQRLTPQHAIDIADKLIEQALTGDLAAIRELLDRTIGKPAPQEVLERLEKLEEQMNLPKEI